MEKSFDFLCSLLRNGDYTVEIKRKTKPRTIPQNSLMWMWYTCMAESTGQDKEDFHDYYRAKFLKRHVMVKGCPYTVIGSTTKLTTEQMTDFLERVKADAASEFGITLPLPEDQNFQSFVSEYRSKI